MATNEMREGEPNTTVDRHKVELVGAGVGVLLVAATVAAGVVAIANGLPHIHIELPFGDPANGTINDPAITLMSNLLHGSQPI